MSAVFADTYYYLALMNPRDSANSRAVEFSARWKRRIVTTTWVLVEVADALAYPPQRPLFGLLMDALRSDRQTLVRPATESIFQRGVEFYESRPDKAWSLTDCISFLTMTDHDLTDALTGDHHFEQAGYVALLK